MICNCSVQLRRSVVMCNCGSQVELWKAILELWEIILDVREAGAELWEAIVNTRGASRGAKVRILKVYVSTGFSNISAPKCVFLCKR